MFIMPNILPRLKRCLDWKVASWVIYSILAKPWWKTHYSCS